MKKKRRMKKKKTELIVFEDIIVKKKIKNELNPVLVAMMHKSWKMMMKQKMAGPTPGEFNKHDCVSKNFIKLLKLFKMKK